MDEKENLNNGLNNMQNPNLSNNQPNNSGLGNNTNPVEQNTEENPYYNPYFQNDDLSNSPYLSENSSNVALNNDIYNQSYMDIYSNGDISQDSNTPDEPIPENTQNESVNSNESIDLFNMGANEDKKEHINPILSQTVNTPEPQNNLNDNTQAFDNNQFETNPQNLGNEPFSNTGNYVDNSQFVNQQPTEPQFGAVNPILNNNYAQPQNPNNNGFENYTEPQTFNNNNIENYTEPQNFNNNNIENYTEPQNFNNNNIENYAEPQNFNNNQMNSFGNDNDEDFKKIWMDKLYEKANTKKFSIPAFFFGSLYYLYRKLYLPGFVFLLISCLIPIIGLSLIPTLPVAPLIATLIALIMQIIYGFAFYPLYKSHINGKLAKSKNEVQSPNQLLDIAKNKGGKSVLFVVLGILLNTIITGIAITTIGISVVLDLLDSFLPNSNTNTQQTPNSNQAILNDLASDNTAGTMETFNFYGNYYFEYDSTNWLENENGALVNGNYTLSYIQALENLTNFGYDTNLPEGRTGFHTYLYNLFSSQIDATTTTLELGQSSFIYQGGLYYSYIDLVYATSIERCYFLVIPEKDIFIEFILSNADTVIPENIHEEVLGMLETITDETQQDENDTTLPNDSNGLNTNNININDTTNEPNSNTSNSTNNTSLNNDSTNSIPQNNNTTNNGGIDLTNVQM